MGLSGVAALADRDEAGAPYPLQDRESPARRAAVLQWFASRVLLGLSDHFRVLEKGPYPSELGRVSRGGAYLNGLLRRLANRPPVGFTRPSSAYREHRGL